MNGLLSKVTNGRAMLGYILTAALSFLALVILVGAGVQFLLTNDASGLAWMTYAGGGFIIIVTIMIMVSMVYRAMEIHDGEQALGMPKGSVRSLLMFLVFTLLGVFVFFSVDSISQERKPGQIIVPDSVIGERIEQLGDSIEVTSILSVEPRVQVDGKDRTVIAMTKVEFDRVRSPGDDVTDLIDQIAIAIFSMASSIIGFYFGTRSQVPVMGGNRTTGQPQGLPITPLGEEDSPDWSLGAAQITLSAKDRGYVGEIQFTGEDLSAEHAFAGRIVPPQDDRSKYEAFDVSVTRSGQTLSVHVTGPEDPSLTGAQLSLYPVDHDDVALVAEVLI